MIKKIISFDIGIKNLAFCLFTYDTETENIQIIDWDILNLMNPTTQLNENPISILYKTSCCECHKKGIFDSPTGDKKFCEKHAKMSPFFTPVIKLQTKTREELKQILDKKFIDKEMTKGAMIEHIKKNMLKKSKPAQKTQDISLIDIGKRLTTLLSERISLENINYVLIENQIGNLANRMKTIQGMVTEFFIIKTPETHIEYVSSHNKLKVLDIVKNQNPVVTTEKKQKKNPVIPENETLVVSSNYTENKKQSIEIVLKICPQTHLDFFLSHKKKDDLADCFLQGVWFVKVKNK